MWVVEKWRNSCTREYNERPTIFHIHNNYRIFILFEDNNFCPLCKKGVPQYIQFQWKLLDGIAWKGIRKGIRRIYFFRRPGENHFGYDYSTKKISEYSNIIFQHKEGSIEEIKELLEEYGFVVD